MKPQGVSILLMMALWIASPAHAAEPPVPQRPATQPAGTALTVAVLDFDSSTPGDPDLGKQIGTMIVSALTDEHGIQVVDRSDMGKILTEHELNLSGLVDPAAAVKIGRFSGARIIITGRAFALDKQLVITARLIGSETSLTNVITVKAPLEADTGALMAQLGQKIAQRLRADGAILIASDESMIDPIPALKARLAGSKLPSVCVNIAERGLPRADAVPVDPAVETEVKKALIAAGFRVIEGNEAELDHSGVEIAVTGEAFSEFNARIGNLISCSGRVELKAALRKEGQVLFSDRATARSVDLAESIAGKTALEKGGRELAIKLLQHFAQTLPAKPGAKPVNAG